MASTVYPLFKQALLGDDVGVDFDTADVRVTVVDTNDYTYSASHEFLDDVASGRIATSGALQNPTITNGVYDADDITITGVTGDQSEALILYQHTGTESTSRLLCYIDSATGLPVTPSGGDLVITWNGSGIFSL